MKKKEKEIGDGVEQLALKIGDEKIFTHRDEGQFIRFGIEFSNCSADPISRAQVFR